MGMRMPTNDVRTNGKRQYPNTEADRGYVSVLDRCEELAVPWWWSWWDEDDEASCGDSGGDMRERMICKEVLPRRATP